MALVGHDYLKKINQPCEVDGGPVKCALLFCLENSSIWLCNDNTSRISLSCADLADYVLDIVGDVDCASGYNFDASARLLFTQGQLFDTPNFNIIIGGGSCKV